MNCPLISRHQYYVFPLDLAVKALRQSRPVARFDQERNGGVRSASVNSASRDASILSRPGPAAVEHGNLLYDEQGLPK